MNTIFITGTSSGIGKATAKLFAQSGWTVIATMRSPEKETELTEFENVHIYPLDITDSKQVQETCSKVLGKYDVDVLFNNAGYGMKSRFEDMKEETILKSMDTNILGFVRVTQQFIPYFKKNKKGIILTTTSLAGEMGLILDGIYAADKWAVTGMCEMLYYELAPYNIQVKTLVPGVVKTGFKMDGGEHMPEEYQMYVDRQIKVLMPDMDCLEEPEEAAEDVWYAVNDKDKDRLSYFTGKVSKELMEKRYNMGVDGFRRYYKKLLLEGDM